jgi:hypothetical protein
MGLEHKDNMISIPIDQVIKVLEELRKYKGASNIFDSLYQSLSDQYPDTIQWESTTPCYTKFVSTQRYNLFSDKVKQWYKPILKESVPQ